MQGEVSATPVPEKRRDYLLIDILRCSPLALKPTAEPGDYPNLLLCRPSCIPSLREVPGKGVNAGTDGTTMQPL